MTMTLDPQDLSRRWEALRSSRPTLRIRDAARELAVSECELLATRCGGGGVTRLSAPAAELLTALPALGRVMALTRNDACVIERKGSYRDVSARGHMGLVVGPEIDLRVFLNRWHHAFAVQDEERGGLRRSLQVFDSDGTAVHKVYLLDESDLPAFEALVERFRSSDATSRQAVTPAAPARPPRADAEIDVPGFRAAWAGLKDTHDFFVICQRFGVARLQALRLADPAMAYRVALDSPRTALERASASGLPIMIFVASPGCIEIHTGPVQNIKAVNGWINVLDPDLNLHLREDAVDSAWVVAKPTADGVVTAVECYDRAGEQVVQLFGKRKPGTPELGDWRTLCAGLARA